MSVRQLTQWKTNSKIIFKTMKNYRNDNEKIAKYFERERLPEKNYSNHNKILIDNNTNSKDIDDTPRSKNYLYKNKRSFRIREKQVEGNSTTPNDNEHDNSNDMHSMLQSPTNKKLIIETNNTTKFNNSNIPILTEHTNN